MAIGLARMFGFHFPENFRGRTRPSRSPTSGVGGTCRCRNGFATTCTCRSVGTGRAASPRTATSTSCSSSLACGTVPAWTFILWGLYHGTLLVYERRHPRLRGAHGLPPEHMSRGRETWLRARAFFLVMLGLACCSEPPACPGPWDPRGLCWCRAASGVDLTTDVALTRERLVVIALASVVAAAPWVRVRTRSRRGPEHLEQDAAPAAVAVVGALLAALLVAAGTFSPFLYYQF